MIDMRPIDERVERHIDRRKSSIAPERAVRVAGDEVVLTDPALVEPFERVEPVQAYEREPRFGEGAPRSPPVPLTARTVTGSPVIGSGSVSFAEVLPPAKFVMRRSDPSRLDLPMRCSVSTCMRVDGIAVRRCISRAAVSSVDVR